MYSQPRYRDLSFRGPMKPQPSPNSCIHCSEKRWAESLFQSRKPIPRWVMSATLYSQCLFCSRARDCGWPIWKMMIVETNSKPLTPHPPLLPHPLSTLAHHLSMFHEEPETELGRRGQIMSLLYSPGTAENKYGTRRICISVFLCGFFFF